MDSPIFNEKTNNESHRLDLNYLDEVRDDALRRMMRYKKKRTKYHDQRFKLRRFNPGDLGLRRVAKATKDPTKGNLNLTWQGLYNIVKYSKRGTYYLESLDGKQLSRPWNVEHFKRYYY